jgi:hypothetical protein
MYCTLATHKLHNKDVLYFRQGKNDLNTVIFTGLNICWLSTPARKKFVHQTLLHLRNNAHLHHRKLRVPLYLVSREVPDLQLHPSKCKMCEKNKVYCSVSVDKKKRSRRGNVDELFKGFFICYKQADEWVCDYVYILLIHDTHNNIL